MIQRTAKLTLNVSRVGFLLIVNYFLAGQIIQGSRRILYDGRSLGHGALESAVIESFLHKPLPNRAMRKVKVMKPRKGRNNNNNNKKPSISLQKSKRKKWTGWDSAANVSNVDSPACRPSWKRHAGNGSIRRIFFAHTRKAGGTGKRDDSLSGRHFIHSVVETSPPGILLTLSQKVLKKFLQIVAKEYKWEISYVEGRPAEDPVRDDTLYVTSLRDPVARALSNYKYEVRWPCAELTSLGNNSNFVPTPENSKTLEDFMEHESGKFSQRQCWRKPSKRHLWRCAKNCYLRWYGHNFNCLKDPEKSYKTTLRKLLGYNLIVIAERLRDPSYIQGLLHMFGDLNTTILSKTQKMYCFDESRYWNQKHPAVVNSATLANLTKLNALDTKLYRELTSCANGIVFPDFERKWKSTQVVAPG